MAKVLHTDSVFNISRDSVHYIGRLVTDSGSRIRELISKDYRQVPIGQLRTIAQLLENYAEELGEVLAVLDAVSGIENQTIELS